MLQVEDVFGVINHAPIVMNKTIAHAVFLLSVFTTIAGQLLLKKATSSQRLSFDASNLVPSLMALATNPFLLAWILFAGVSAALWIYVLSRFELSLAFPVSTTLSYILILVLSWWLFGEQMTIMRWIGIGLMCVGIFMTYQG
jgi:multidrug transporter EmrE-like cation transporter